MMFKQNDLVISADGKVHIVTGTPPSGRVDTDKDWGYLEVELSPKPLAVGDLVRHVDTNVVGKIASLDEKNLVANVPSLGYFVPGKASEYRAVSDYPEPANKESTETNENKNENAFTHCACGQVRNPDMVPDVLTLDELLEEIALRNAVIRQHQEELRILKKTAKVALAKAFQVGK